MSFVNQIQNVNFVNQQVKALKVICQKCVQETGDITIVFSDFGIELKSNVDITIEPCTPELLTTEALMSKVVSVGIVPAKVTIQEQCLYPITLPIQIPFQSVIECPGVEPCDNVQIHDLQLEAVTPTIIGVLTTEEGVANLTPALMIKVIVQSCVLSVGKKS